jgi:uncharacterized protein (TIGR02722 family)
MVKLFTVRNLKISLLFLVASLLQGCATEAIVKYGDSKAVETVNTDFGSSDLLQLSERMTRSILDSKVVTGSREPPIITLAGVKNKTSDYIDTNAISGRIRAQLTKSGNVRFVASISEMQNQVDELKRQNQTDLYAKETTSSMGNMTGSRYRVEGEITSIVKQNKKIKDVFYNLHLTMFNNQTGEIVWEDDQDIRKTASR